MLPKSIQNLIEEFARLPGIGPKTAARLTFYLLNKSSQDVQKLAQAVGELKAKLVYCQKCFNISEENPCAICQDKNREQKIICLVEEPLDILALEKTNYQGLYHVLGGVISPIDDIGPEDLRIRQLLNRLKKDKNIKEVILATDPSLEGEATALYIQKEVENWKKSAKINRGVNVTRLARGLPVGGDLEYADEVTLTRALEGRREF